MQQTGCEALSAGDLVHAETYRRLKKGVEEPDKYPLDMIEVAPEDVKDSDTLASAKWRK